VPPGICPRPFPSRAPSELRRTAPPVRPRNSAPSTACTWQLPVRAGNGWRFYSGREAEAPAAGVPRTAVTRRSGADDPHPAMPSRVAWRPTGVAVTRLQIPFRATAFVRKVGIRSNVTRCGSLASRHGSCLLPLKSRLSCSLHAGKARLQAPPALGSYRSSRCSSAAFARGRSPPAHRSPRGPPLPLRSGGCDATGLPTGRFASRPICPSGAGSIPALAHSSYSGVLAPTVSARSARNHGPRARNPASGWSRAGLRDARLPHAALPCAPPAAMPPCRMTGKCDLPRGGW
jgi:hypothetical protein